MPEWLHIVSWVCVLAGLATSAAILAHVRRHPQRMRIMNLVWPVTGLYLPIFGWWLYRALAGPRARNAREEVRGRACWESVFLSASHCGSGCVIGDVIGAPIVAAAGFAVAGERLFGEYIVEFAIAYLCGIAFQYIPIRAMRELPPRAALAEAVKADTLSLVAFEFGMFAWMAVSRFLLFAKHPPEVSSMVFWLMMQAGMLLGFTTTLPANWLLVRWGVKNSM